MEAWMMVKKKKSFPEEANATVEPVTIEEVTPVNDFRADLEEIKTWNNVIGYILRNTTSASIDLKDPTKIIDYAMLSSSALDAAEELSKLFDLGKTTHIVVEGKEIKVLSLAFGENKISVFLEKDADCEKVLRKLR
jgi:predicted regulator of Ras-like GTPase activity (Roadblock/LC7/MglB family)